jgi:putative FmdB family regulatory protein
MPIFEYKCKQCGDEFEKLVFNRADAIDCPKCHTHDVAKKFSAFGMKSGSKFVSSSGSGCGNCSSHSCGSCSH